MGLLSFLAILLAGTAHAGKVVWVDSSLVTSYSYHYGQDCDSFDLGAGGQVYTFRFCALQSIVQGDLDAMLTSPAKQECVKFESCRNGQCYREFGTREESVKLMLLVGARNKIETYKVKRDLGPCQ